MKVAPHFSVGVAFFGRERPVGTIEYPAFAN